MRPANESRLLEKMLSSDTKADLLVLFNENPTLTDRKDAVAKRIGRTPSQIDGDLRDLLEIGLLFKENFGSDEIIGYDPKRAAKIRELISSQITDALESDE